MIKFVCFIFFYILTVGLQYQMYQSKLKQYEAEQQHLVTQLEAGEEHEMQATAQARQEGYEDGILKTNEIARKTVEDLTVQFERQDIEVRSLKTRIEALNTRISILASLSDFLIAKCEKTR
jgi:flagellar biosynthesis/type III secretory pathway protein FliH